MKAVPIQTEYFSFDGRGPELKRWIKDGELHFPDSDHGFGALAGSIDGAEHDWGWVIFFSLQVIQIVPEEVHTYWHLGYADKSEKSTGVWIINNSEWLASFNPRHLANYNHYLFEFYDEIVEVIIREPIFGTGTFKIVDVIEKEPRLNDAYIRKSEF